MNANASSAMLCPVDPTPLAMSDRDGGWGCPSGAYDHDLYDRRLGYPKLRKSFLSELFD